MKVRVNNRVIKIEMLNNNYSDHAVEVRSIEPDYHFGVPFIAEKCDIVNDAPRKLSFEQASIEYDRTTKMFMGEYEYGWKAIYRGIVLASERTKKKCVQEARKAYKALVAE